MTATKDDAAFVLDDGITGFFGHDVHLGNSGQTFVLYGADDYYWITWIGTGFSFTSEEWGAGTHHVVQNLPYGSHMLRCTRDADAHPDYLVDGVPIVVSVPKQITCLSVPETNTNLLEVGAPETDVLFARCTVDVLADVSQ